MNNKQKELAHEFCNSIKALAENENNLNNLESYLSRHFEVWLEKYAHDADGLVSEMNIFATMNN